MSTVKALGENYFGINGFPVVIKRVHASETPQHPHDLTGIPHYHDFSELVFITEGYGVQSVDGIDYNVRAGDIFLVQGFIEHYFKERNSISHINVMFDPARLPLALEQLRKIPGYNIIFELEPSMRGKCAFKNRLHLENAGIERAGMIIQRMDEELQERKSGFEISLFNLLLELIIYVSRQYSMGEQGNESALVRIGHVISALEKDCAARWTLKKIAKLAGMSPNNLMLLFNAAAGISPIAYVLRNRLRRAASELREGKKSISEISAGNGFSDSNYFSKKFKSAYKLSPRAYRNKFISH
jgi:AraC-like DNA-binding protein